MSRAPRHPVPAAALDAGGRDSPPIATPLGLAFGVGALLVALWTVLPHATGAHEGAILALDAVALAIGLGLLSPLGRRLPRGALSSVVAAGTLLVTAAIYFGGASDTNVAFLYLWCVPYVFAYFPRRDALLQAGLIAVCFATVLVVLHASADDAGRAALEQHLAGWLLAIGTLLAVGWLVRHLAASLRESEARFTSGFEASQVGMALMGLDRRWLRVNRAFCGLLGHREDELVGRDPTQLGGMGDASACRVAVDAALRQGEPVSFEHEIARPDGSRVWLQVKGSPIADARGRPRHLLCHVEDVTARHRTDAERQQAAARLSQRIAEHETVAALGQRALETADVARVLDEAVAVVAQTLDADFCKVLELLPCGRELRLVAGAGWGPGLVRHARIPAGPQSQAGFTLLTGQPVIVPDLHAERRFTGADLLHDHDVTSGISVIVGGRTEPYGVLSAHTREPHAFTADDALFLAAVANVLSSAIERAATEEETRRQALHDALTGLPNRTLFLDHLAQALKRARRVGTHVAVLLLDIDEFKVLNDSIGHHAGDELLAVAAPRLAESVRASDTVARLGGDEFAVVCEDVGDEHHALALAERLTASWSRPFSLSTGDVYVSASIGVALSNGGDGTAATLLREADAAMYRAKERGRGRVELFDERMRAAALDRLRMKNDLQRALAQGELSVVYQPIVELESERLTGVEALLRWDHPERGPIPPAEFVPLAEETGLIVPIGDWVLEQASAQVADWQRVHGADELLLCVNLSGRQLLHPELAGRIEGILAASGLPPSSLGIEITESVLMEELESPLETLQRLKALGVRVLLDDFGTGYSSLSYLRRFPLDVLKVDRSFVDRLGADDEDSAIVAAITTMAQTLGLGVIAEGVERPAQLEHLRRLGCTHAQGYLFTPPLPPAELEALLGRAGALRR